MEAAALPQDSFPLEVLECAQCRHAQLSVVVDPARLFRAYPYVSGTSSVFVDHFRAYASALVRDFRFGPGSLAVEIGSNDGTLLSFLKEHGLEVIGVDPAIEIAKRATGAGIPTIPEFFTYELATRLRSERGSARLVIANNVFAHIDALEDVVRAVRALLAPDGVFVFEVAYVVDLLQKSLFDTIYHEHLSYHGVLPLRRFLSANGLSLFDCRRVPTHGGSIRCFASWPGARAIETRVDELCALEERCGLGSKVPELCHPWRELSDRVERLRQILRSRIFELKKGGARVGAYGAPAKATTLVHQFGLGREHVSFAIDDNPLKQGFAIPGTQIPIVPSAVGFAKQPTHLLIFAWNFAESIIEKHADFRSKGGRFLVPLPEYSEV